MNEIETALLTGQRQVTINGILINLNPPLKTDTLKKKEREARTRAKELIEIIQS